MTTYDAIIIGGGPAGSTCARFLARGGARVAIVDRADFPRVKLCAGWISAPIWDALELTPRDYTGGLWEWNKCHVYYRGADHAIACRGWFVRRYELDDFLLRRSGAALHLGTSVKDIARDADGMWTVAGLRARHLVGAGGTHCPVAKMLAPPRARKPVGVQEHEFQTDAAAVARTRIGADGEPELLLFDDLGGYAWNVPKTAWMNVGVGTFDPNEVRNGWRHARGHFEATGHVPGVAKQALDQMKGHSYHLFDPLHLGGAARVDAGGGGAYLIGDALGLAQPVTAEGILPSVVSGRVLAEAILDKAPATYPARLRAHPLFADYARVFGFREAMAALLRKPPLDPAAAAPPPSPPSGRAPELGPGARLGRRAIATGFAWMFSGARLPAPRLVDVVLAGARRWTARREAP